MSGDEGEFMLVVGHRRRGRAKLKPTGHTSLETFNQAQRDDGSSAETLRAVAKTGTLSVAKTVAEVRRMAKALAADAVGAHLAKGLAAALRDARPAGAPLQLQCLGLGSAVASEASRWQLAMFLLCRKAADEREAGPAVHAAAFDPVFNDSDAAVLGQLDVEVLRENAEGKVSPEAGALLLFMPHCSRSLYANLLYSNWAADQLARLVVVGNTFSDYVLRAVTKADKQTVDGMRRLEGHMCEDRLPRFGGCPEAFDDTSVMWFPAEKLAEVKGLGTALPARPAADHDVASC